MNNEELIESIDELVYLSKHYFYDKDYEKYIKILNKIKKKLKDDDTSFLKKGCELE